MKQITVEEIAKKFNITLEEFDKIIDDFYNKKLKKVNDKILTSITIDILRIINLIALRCAHITEFLEKYSMTTQSMETILTAYCTLIEIIMSTANRNDITKPIKLIRNWLKTSINMLKDRMNISSIEALETLTVPLYALDDMLAKLEKENNNRNSDALQ